MASIIKTIRFPADDNVIKHFLELQSNLTRSLQYLVMKYCRDVGYNNLQDLSEAYNQFKIENLYNMPCQALPPKKEQEQETHAVQKPSVSPEMVPDAKTVVGKSTGIPSCYQ